MSAGDRHTIIDPHVLTGMRFRDLFRYRELLYFLTLRDIKIRYRQTIFGVAWAVLQHVLPLAVFSLVIGRFGKMESDGFPYPLFTFAALLPWQLFVHSLTESGNSVIANQSLITKIYFPRLVIPMAPVIAGLVDFGIGLGILLVIMLWYGFIPTILVLTLPIFILLALVAAVGVGLWLSALNVEFRDVKYTIPFLAQFWFFVTPVFYPLSLIDEKWRILYSLNPMTGVVEGFRWAILGKEFTSVSLFVFSIAVAVLLFLSGAFYFRRREDTFSDTI